MSIYKSEIGKIEIQEYYDNLLKSIETEYEILSTKTSFGNTSIIKSGIENGEPVVLLHGGGINSSMWVSDINELSKNYQVFATDILGECGKSGETLLSYKNNDYSEWLSEVFSYLKLDVINIVGASLGGWIGLKYAINYPTKVNKLILFSPAGIGGQNPKFLPIALLYMMLNKRKELFVKINGTEIPEEMINYQILINKNYNSRKDVLPVYNDSDLNKIDAKTSIYIGKNDIILNSQKTKERSKQIRNVKVEVFENLGHSLINMTKYIIKDLEG